MCNFVVKSLGIALVLMLVASGAVGDNSQITDSPISQPVGDADVICTAIILGTWRTGDSGNASSSEASENGRAEVDKVLKGKLTRTKITFQGSTWMVPEDLRSGHSVDANSITLTRDLRPGTRYMLFLSSNSADRRNPFLTYKLDFSIPLAPNSDKDLRLDASKINPEEQKREILGEFVKAASFVLDSHGNAADAYDYFSYIYQYLPASWNGHDAICAKPSGFSRHSAALLRCG